MFIKKTFLVSYLLFVSHFLNAQFIPGNLSFGPVFQKTQKLYWENGIGADYSSTVLLNNRLHLKAAFVTSSLGSAMGSNAIKQSSVTIGANIHFRKKRSLQFFTGVNTGYFHANYEEDLFKVLPQNSMLLQGEAGVYYKFLLPVTAALSAGYNVINGNGIDKPGTLYPVFYQFKIFYKLK